METPHSTKNEYRPSRNFTPRLSERKKKLFASNGTQEVHENVTEEDCMFGITPLRTSSRRQNAETPKSKRSIESMLLSNKCAELRPAISFLSTESESDGDKHNLSPTRRSMRLSLKNISPGNKENRANVTRVATADEQQLQQMFTASMNLSNQQTPKIINNNLTIDESSDEEENHTNKPLHAADHSTQKTLNKSLTIDESSDDDEDHINAEANSDEQSTQKRQLAGNKSTGESPKRKVPKLKLSIELVSISTKSFYSAPPKQPHNSTHFKPTNLNSGAATKVSPRSRRTNGSNVATPSIYRGVKHKTRKRPRLGANSGQHAPRQTNSVDIDLILSNLRNEKLRNLITSKRQERAQIEKVHNIFRLAENPIQMARPLSIITNDDKNNNNNNNNNTLSNKNGTICARADESDFSDIDYDSDEQHAMLVDKEDVIPLITHQINEAAAVKEVEQVNSNRKFFKSKRTNVMQVKLNGNIRARVCNGKISLVEEKKRKKPRRRPTITNEFSDEQATVDAILKNLDDTAFGDMIESVITNDTNIYTENGDDIITSEEDLQQLEHFTNDLLSDIQLEDSNDYADFRNRLPYNTDDPAIIEQQHLLLDFLISNNICTEENFTIFIADPDNHKEEASRIIDGVVIVLNKEQMKYRDMLPYNTDDPVVIEQQYNFLDFLMENDICTEENFDIFIANYDKRRAEADEIITRIQIQQDEMLPLSVDNEQHEDYQQQEQLIKTTADGNNLQTVKCNSENAEAALRYNSPTMQALIYTDMVGDTNKTNNAVPTQTRTPTPTQDHASKSDKLFPIFTEGARTHPLIAPKSSRRAPSNWQGGFGATQLQIDAGQKHFGATQCKQCGLVYTVHEPEEERLHREYHASLHILRFKGWIDEDIVAIYPEWGADGRILRLSNTSHQKRRERLTQILKIVDKELGFSSYIMPTNFMAYMAVRRNQIVGVCLAQPLKEANKYLCINNVDCCTEETFEAKCGIARIWVSPLHRRMHVAAKLINAVQLNTIIGEDIPFDKLAFSAPTEMGRIFAQKITQMDDFLVYQ